VRAEHVDNWSGRPTVEFVCSTASSDEVVFEDMECVELAMRDDVDPDIAKAEIVAHVSRHPGADAFDISTDLLLPYRMTEAILNELVRSGVLVAGG
jgi:hypothetical protein